MSAAAPPPPPPPPAAAANSNQLPHYIDSPSEPMTDKKNKSKKPLRRRWCKHLKPPQSPKVATPTEQPTRRSFIWPWLEGKLEKKPSSFSGEGSSLSPRVSDSGPVLAPLPVCAIMGLQTESIMLGSFDDELNNLVAVYDPFFEEWRYMSVDDYIAIFDAPSPASVPEVNLTQLESNCIDVLRSGFSLEEVTQIKEEENVVNIENKEENEVEENVEEEKKEKELQVYVRRSKMTHKTKAVQIGEIEVQVPVKNSEKENVNPARSSLSSANVGDGTANEKLDELPRVAEDGQGSGIADQKKGKKKNKNNGKKK